MSKLTISNPVPGGPRHISTSRADRYVRRGEAVRIGDTLHFLEASEQRQMRHIESVIESERRASDVYVTGMVYWNGEREPDGLLPPGIARS